MQTTEFIRNITIPEKASCKLTDRVFTVTGPKGTVSQEIADGIMLTVSDQKVSIDVDGGHALKKPKAMVNTFYALITNQFMGVTEGFQVELSMVGVGYSATLEGTVLSLQVGKSHLDRHQIPDGITVTVPKKNEILVVGSDKQKVGQFVANVCRSRPLEPYKLKGISKKGHTIKKKEGKKK